MTTITVVRKAGIAAIATDSLTKCGSIRESATYVVNHQKIVSIGGNFVAVSGATSLKLALREFFAESPQLVELTSVPGIFRTWLRIHEKLKDCYFLIPDDSADASVESSQMDALIAGPSGIFGVGWDRTVQEFSRFGAYGNGRELALGAMYAAYELTDWSAEEIARFGVNAAAEFDDCTGLPVLSHSVALNDDT